MRRRVLIFLTVCFILASGVSSAVARRDKKKSKQTSARASAKRAKPRARSTRRGRISRTGRRHRNSRAIHASTRQPRSSIPRERVIEIQERLAALGFFDGPASGDYDQSTIDAMKRFQARHGLSASGLPSAPSLKRLGVSKNSNDGYSTPVKRDAVLSPDNRKD
jgi:murein L,D-transpeptidase YcbB/YkuD